MNRLRIGLKISAIVFLSAIVISCNNDKNKSVSGVSKKIKEQTQYQITSESDKGTPVEKKCFDTNGKLMKLVSYSDFSTDSSVFIYNNLQQLVKRTSVIDGESTFTDYQYDANGKMVEEKWYRDNGQGDITKFVYDNQSNIAEEIHYNLDGKKDFSRIFERKYNDKNQIVLEKKIERYTDGTEDLLQYIVTYLYNQKDSVSERSHLSATGEVENKTKYVYNANGLLVEEYEYGYLGDNYSVITYEYDNQGRGVGMIESNFDKECKNRIAYYNRFTKYNDFGLEELFFATYVGEGNSTPSGVRYEYSYYE